MEMKNSDETTDMSKIRLAETCRYCSCHRKLKKETILTNGDTRARKNIKKTSFSRPRSHRNKQEKTCGWAEDEYQLYREKKQKKKNE